MTSETQSNPEPVQLPIAPSHVRSVALAELDLATAFVRDLALDEWSKPSAARGWSVGDVVAHLNLSMGVASRLIAAATAGRGSGPVWRTLGEATKKVAPAAAPALDAINSAIPRLIDRTLSPEVIKGQFAAGSRTLRERLEKVESPDFTRPVFYVGGPWPLSYVIAILVNELAVHRWDIASQLQIEAHLSDGARTVLPWLYWSGTPIMLRLPKGTSGTVQVSLVDPAIEIWWSLAESDKRQGVGSTPNPDVTLTGETGTFVLALAGRIPPDDALRTTSLTATGNGELARTFLGAWKLV